MSSINQKVVEKSFFFLAVINCEIDDINKPTAGLWSASTSDKIRFRLSQAEASSVQILLSTIYQVGGDEVTKKKRKL